MNASAHVQRAAALVAAGFIVGILGCDIGSGLSRTEWWNDCAGVSRGCEAFTYYDGEPEMEGVQFLAVDSKGLVYFWY